MISEEKLAWIKEELFTGKVHAIVAYETVQALKIQQREIMQLNDQLRNCQGKCGLL